jgi:hypothetical protein
VPLADVLTQLLLEQRFESLVCSVGCGLTTGYAADQIGHLVIEAVRKDGIRMSGEGIADDARLGNSGEPGGLAEPCLDSRVKPNAFHVLYCITPGRKMYYKEVWGTDTCGRPSVTSARVGSSEDEGHRTLQ